MASIQNSDLMLTTNEQIISGLSVSASHPRAVLPAATALQREHLELLLSEWGYDPELGAVIERRFFQEHPCNFEEFTDLSEDLRQRLASSFRPYALSLLEEIPSPDGLAVKRLFQSPGNKIIESVSILSAERHAVCVSSQFGCAMGCTFCATGLDGLDGNLDACEIFEQVLFAQKLAGRKVTNVVFMGMGEPFHNFDQCLQAADWMHAPERLGLPGHKITFSTSGLVPGIQRLARYPRSYDLAVSLHAANNVLRSQLVPVNRKYPIETLLDAVAEYIESKQRPVAFEYVLLRDVNDSEADATALASLVHGPNRRVTLIPFNSVPGLPYERPTPERVDSFQRLLLERGVPCAVRNSKGSAIAGACGQLRRIRVGES